MVPNVHEETKKINRRRFFFQRPKPQNPKTPKPRPNYLYLIIIIMEMEFDDAGRELVENNVASEGGTYAVFFTFNGT
jgi:hypothetical protein